MRKNRKNTERDQPIGQLKKIADFLPPPEQLVIPEEMVKVTIALDRRSLEFFKHHATRLGTKYQKMLREVIRNYALHYA